MHFNEFELHVINKPYGISVKFIEEIIIKSLG